MDSDNNSSIFHPDSSDGSDSSDSSNSDSSNSSDDQMESDYIAKRRRDDLLYYNFYQFMQQQAIQTVVRKRRTAVATAMMAVATVATNVLETRSSSHVEPRLDFEKFTHKLNTEPGDKFYNMFRVQSISFNKSWMLLEPHCLKDLRMSNLQTRGHNPVTTQLSLHCCIRWLAGGSYHDIRNHVGVLVTTFHACKNL